MLLVPLLSLSLGMPAQENDATPPRQIAGLLSFDQVESRLDDPEFLLLDVRPLDDYRAGHIPGALWVDASEVGELAKQPGALEEPARWEGWITRLGLGPETAVAVYDDNRQKDAARFWWLLGYLGVDEVALIDGGFPLWEEQGRPISTDAPEVEPRSFPVRLRADRHASRSEVLEGIESDSVQVVDARSIAEFIGEQALSARGGHVPGACHLEWATLVDEQGRFLPEEAVLPRLKAFGLTPDRPVITHCQGGGRASVNAFVLQRLGFPTRNYYLGWSDWGNAEETPIDLGGAPSLKP